MKLAQATRVKIGKREYLKIKNFWASKDTVSKAKGHLWNGRKYLQIVISHESNIQNSVHRALLKLNNQKWNNPIKNGQSTLIDISSKKIDRWPLSTWKDAHCHRSRETQVGTRRGPTRKNKQETTSVADELSCPVGGNVKWCSCCGRQYGGSSERYIRGIFIWLSNSTPWYKSPKTEKRLLKRHLCSIIHNSQKEATHVSNRRWVNKTRPIHTMD